MREYKLVKKTIKRAVAEPNCQAFKALYTGLLSKVWGKEIYSSDKIRQRSREDLVAVKCVKEENGRH